MDVVAALDEAFGSPLPRTLVSLPFAEKMSLELDSSLALRQTEWRQAIPFDAGVCMTAEWYRHWMEGGDLRAVTERQIEAFLDMVELPVMA